LTPEFYQIHFLLKVREEVDSLVYPELLILNEAIGKMIPDDRLDRAEGILATIRKRVLERLCKEYMWDGP